MTALVHHRAGADALVEARIAVAFRALGVPLRASFLVVDTETIGPLPCSDTGATIWPGRLVVELGACVVTREGVGANSAALIAWPEEDVHRRRIGQGHWITHQCVGMTEADFIIHPDGTFVDIDHRTAAKRIRRMFARHPVWTAYNAEFDYGALSESFPHPRIPAPSFDIMYEIHRWLAKEHRDILQESSGRQKYKMRKMNQEAEEAHCPPPFEKWQIMTKTPKAIELLPILDRLGSPVEGWTR